MPKFYYIHFNKKSKVKPLSIPAESEDKLQNKSDSDDEEYIISETDEEILKVKLRRKSLKVIQTISK